MNKFDELLNELNEEILNEKNVQEYFRLKKEIENNSELKELDKNMRVHQKKMCENENNDEIYLKEKSQYEDCKNKLESNPLWQNFQIIKEEVYSFLVEIKNLLS